jgi:Tfp pilus assembly protein PilX
VRTRRIRWQVARDRAASYALGDADAAREALAQFRALMADPAPRERRDQTWATAYAQAFLKEAEALIDAATSSQPAPSQSGASQPATTPP